MKRLFDVVVSAALLLLLAPVLLLSGLLIRIALGSPVLFKQMRPGLHGRPFELIKFRTMRDSRDNKGALLSDEERLTAVGAWLRRSSIDELPELMNVLRGDMSLVGPRPLLMEYLPLYSERQARRHEVRPGITGWAQVNGRNNLAWEQRFEADVWYVENQSLVLDLKILFMTIARVFSRRDVAQDGHVTMEKFRGSAT